MRINTGQRGRAPRGGSSALGGLTVGALRGSLQFVPRRDVVAYACDSRGADALVTTYPTRLILTVAACAVEIVHSARRAGVPGKRVLDLASGPTAVSRLLLDAGAREVVALERDPAMLAAASCLPAPGLGELHVVRADAQDRLPFPDDAFEVVWVGDFWSAAAVAELRRVLRPGGRLVVRLTGPMRWLPEDDMAFLDRIDRATETGLERWLEKADAWRDEPANGELEGWRRIDAWTDELTWRRPVPEMVEEYVLQDFAAFHGRFAAACSDPRDWRRLRALADPASPGYALRRPGARVERVFEHQIYVPEGAAGP